MKPQNEKGGSKGWGAGGVWGGAGARETRERVQEVMRVCATEAAASAETAETRLQGEEEDGAAAGRWISQSAGNERLRAVNLSLSPLSKGKMALLKEREREIERERESLRSASLSPSCKAQLVERARAQASEQESDEKSAGGEGRRRGGGGEEEEQSSTPSSQAKRVMWNQVSSHSSWAGAEACLRHSRSPSSCRGKGHSL